ncbi:hypothetical protein JRQ81_013789 [Phrynocephalus forsythii]|uniref:Uncharacterized protein n=1 Tax=Phrynocephalus forsythii TaxID=171643 RepID=A0A9Q0Y342_9SAUR|nr:hypothetical protein JRQ81_013789 [Phrynocephalus forsythii]
MEGWKGVEFCSEEQRRNLCTCGVESCLRYSKKGINATRDKIVVEKDHHRKNKERGMSSPRASFRTRRLPLKVTADALKIEGHRSDSRQARKGTFLTFWKAMVGLVSITSLIYDVRFYVLDHMSP